MRDILQEHLSWLHHCGCGRFQYTSALASRLHGMEDYAHHLPFDFCALSSSDDVLAPLAVCGRSSKAFCA